MVVQHCRVKGLHRGLNYDFSLRRTLRSCTSPSCILPWNFVFNIIATAAVQIQLSIESLLSMTKPSGTARTGYDSKVAKSPRRKTSPAQGPGISSPSIAVSLDDFPVGPDQPIPRHFPRAACSKTARYIAELNPTHCSPIHATRRAPTAYNCPVS